MKLKELKCKNCGATLEVEEKQKRVKCKFCNTEFHIEDSYDEGYNFEKGRMDAQNRSYKDSPLFSKIILGIVIILIFVVICFIGWQAYNMTKTNPETTSAEDFNFFLKDGSGTQTGFMLEEYIDEVINSNKMSKKHIISVEYNGIKTADTEEIASIKQDLKEDTKYEVSYNYDDKGYIDEMKVVEIK